MARQKGASAGCCLCSPRAVSQGNQEKVSVDVSELAALIRVLLYKEILRSNNPKLPESVLVDLDAPLITDHLSDFAIFQ